MMEIVFYVILILLILVICYSIAEIGDKLDTIISKIDSQNSQEKNLTNALPRGIIQEDIRNQRQDNNEIKLFNPEKY